MILLLQKTSKTPELAVRGRCSPQVSSSPASTKGVEVLRQVSTASNGAGKSTTGEGAKQAFSSGRKATEVTVPASLSRLQAEAKYIKLLENIMAQLESLEAAVRAAPNTKLDVKTGVKAVGAGLREFADIAKKLGMVRNLDAQEQRIRMLQQQQQQQHVKTTKALNDIPEGIRQRGTGDGSVGLSVKEQGARILDIHVCLAEQSDKIDAITEVIARLDTMSHQEVPNGQWSEVANKKTPKKSGPPLATSRTTGLPTTGKVGARKIKPRPAGILIDGGSDADFPALAKKVKNGMDKNTTTSWA